MPSPHLSASPPSPSAARPRWSAALPPDAGVTQACAAAVLEVMPGVMDAMRGAMRRQVGETLSVPQFRCLNHIARRPGCSVGAVAAFLGVTMATASAMVDRLVRAGAVAPRTARADRRRTELHATKAGLAQVRQIERGALEEFASALAPCSEAELRTVQQAMLLLQQAFQQADRPGETAAAAATRDLDGLQLSPGHGT